MRWYGLCIYLLITVSVLGQEASREIRDPAEYNTYFSTVNTCSMQPEDPVRSAATMDRFLSQYPKSAVAEEVLRISMAIEADLGSWDKVQARAEELLGRVPDDLAGLAVLYYRERNCDKNRAEAKPNQKDGTDFAARGLKAIQSDLKPWGLDESSWTSLKLASRELFKSNHPSKDQVMKVLTILKKYYCSPNRFRYPVTPSS